MISCVIVWLNGPFGVGKSTVAIGLKASLANATIVDPEQLGYLLRAWQPPEVSVADFQDLPVWRRLTREAVGGLVRDFGRPVIVPMTLLNASYFDEIVGGLRRDGFDVRHFCLVADRATVLDRVNERGDRGEWFPSKFDEYEASFRDPRFATFIDANKASAHDLANSIRSSLPQSFAIGSERRS
jgi:predicted ABC-type ATPase